MKYEDTSKYKKYKLPDGFSYCFYKEGDINDWVKIHISSKEFSNIKKSFQYFHDFFGSFEDELNKRCIFIVDNETQEKVASATISKLEKEEYGCKATIDFVAIKKEYQGKHLSKPLLSRVIELSKELGYEKVLLCTQTHTWLAVKIYLDMGFIPNITKDSYAGWQIINTIINHEKLSFVDKIDIDRIYSKTAILIYNKLRKIYDSDFNYTIWYKNGLNRVYVLENKNEHIYKYYKGFDDIYLEEIKKT